MYHLHTLIHMSYVYHQMCITRKGNTTIIQAPFLGSGCGRVVQGAGRKSKRTILQCINGVGSNPVEGRTKILRLKIKPNSVRIRFQSCQIFVLPSTGFEFTPLIHCSTNRLTLCPAPQTTRPHPLHTKWSFNSRSVTLSRKDNLEIDLRHVFKRVWMVHKYLIL